MRERSENRDLKMFLGSFYFMSYTIEADFNTKFLNPLQLTQDPLK